MNTPNLFKCITWNVDMRATYEQFHSIIGDIKKLEPDAIFLQEVTDISLKYLMQEIKDTPYQILESRRIDHYFIVTVVNGSTVKVKDHQVSVFTTSRMHRNLLITEIEWNERGLHLINAHLESMGKNAEERSRQLKHVLRTMDILVDTAPVIFAGDTNLRDKEVSEMGGLPDSIKDAWEFLGRPKNSEITWSSNRNCENWPFNTSHLRFDRVFFTGGTGRRIVPREMVPLGTERLSSGLYPSDHIGLYVSFSVN